jgi:hypothetical protein
MIAVIKDHQVQSAVQNLNKAFLPFIHIALSTPATSRRSRKILSDALVSDLPNIPGILPQKWNLHYAFALCNLYYTLIQSVIAVSHSLNSKLHKVQNLLQDYFIKLWQTQNWERGKNGRGEGGGKTKLAERIQKENYADAYAATVQWVYGEESVLWGKNFLSYILIELFVFLISWIIILKRKTE